MKKILISLIIAFFSITWVYANITEEKIIDYKISPEFSWIEQFYRDNLTNNEIKEIKEIYKKYDDVYFANIWKTQKWMNFPKTNLLKNLDYLFSSVRKYIDPNKKEDFYKYIINNRKTKSKENKYMNWSFQITEKTYYVELEKTYKTIKKKFFSEKIREKIKKKLDKIPENKRDKILDRLITKIDLYINRTTNEVKKAKLEELKEIIIDYKNNIDIDDILNIEEITK